jgi:DNA-binding transcriptional MerR regulator
MAEDDDARLTAREMGALCGVTERTVRYYVAEGLLPAPARGRGANFGEKHLVRLRLIRAMQQAGNELDVIREYLAELDREAGDRESVLEGALAIWSGRNEQARWRDEWRKKWGGPVLVSHFRIADGVELLIDQTAALPAARIQQIVRLIRTALELDED